MSFLVPYGFAAALGLSLAADGGAARPSLLFAPVPDLRSGGEDEYPLRPTKDGTGDMVYEAGDFTARVAADGSVAFTDKRATDLSALPWLPLRMRLGVPSLESSMKSLLTRRKPRPPAPADDRSPPDDTRQLIPNISRYRPDTRDERASYAFAPSLLPLSVTGRMDLTDELTRFTDRDPHRYEKARFLTATRETRIRMAVKTHAANIRRAAAELPGRLAAIACDERLALDERRAILEALRGEMDPATPAGRAAAEVIGRFISSGLGQPDGGSPDCPPARLPPAESRPQSP